MEIRGRGDVSSIKLVHKGCEFQYQAILQSAYLDPKPGLIDTPGGITTFIFKDTYELDVLISMLNAFRDGCIREMHTFARIK